MNSYSIESQQNVGKQDNSRIAEIYQRMLSGDRLALSNLQRVKVGKEAKLQQVFQNQGMGSPDKEYSFQRNVHKLTTDKQTLFTNKHGRHHPQSRIQTIKQQQFQQSFNPLQHQQQSDFQKVQTQHKQKQKQRLRSFIRKKVDFLRMEKELMKQEEEKQMNQLKTISKNIKINTINQSKSYDLVKNKNVVMDSPLKEKVKRHQIENNNISKALKKVQSSAEQKTTKNLPFLNHKKKVSTENSDHNMNDSKVSIRKQISTPINLANSIVEASPVTKKYLSHQKAQELPLKNSQDKNKSFEKEKERRSRGSRTIKISLPEMKKQREQFAVINEREINCQLDLVQYHQQTRKVLENVKTKYNLNFKNTDKLKDLRQYVDPQPILTSSKSKQKSFQASSLEIERSQNKKKSHLYVLEEKVSSGKNDINFIEQMIARKRQQVRKMEEKRSRNLLWKYWNQNDLYTYDFNDENLDISEFDQLSHSESASTESRIKQAYSTSMPHTKDKGWKSKVIKQYDTNRSFQQYAKSRSVLKQSVVRKQIVLGKIDEGQEAEENAETNLMVVNSRLRNLLLQ